MRVIRVSKQTACNPVARAVAQVKLREALRAQKIRLYMMEHGEDCGELMDGLGSTMALVDCAATIQGIQGVDTSILNGGLSACRQLARSGSYDPLQTVAIAGALDAAERLNRLIKADAMNEAVKIYNQYMKEHHEDQKATP
jgi:hypothetical protein